MKISQMNWMQGEAQAKRDDRCILPLGSTEQHAYLSLSVDSILAEKLSLDVAESLGIPVFPVLPYGITPYFLDYPGSVSLRVQTYLSVVGDILDSIARHGFRRILIVNGHGGNSPASAFCEEWLNTHAQMRIKFHNWWNAPRTWAQVMQTDKVASHASWMENFPWTRLADVKMPDTPKAPFDRVGAMSAAQMREVLGDGNFAGAYQRSDAEMLAIWQIAIDETRGLLQGEW
jgi:creatinine amidohydrolase